ncbi:phage protein NinX family protein [Klebsiella sp. GW_Kp181]|uniref:phage protein NinX family protein n=1 Tax=Klebsiella sp. GW_Kp181 TaxID=3153492 RepID=UPI0032B43A3C
MDYSKLSDYEVNKYVAMSIGGFEENNFFEAHSVIFKSCGRFQYTCFDPCNNPADAWPIIVEKKISLLWIEESSMWCASQGGSAGNEYWGWDECPDVYHENINPLRAAMIVFLMMQESK